MGKHLLNFIHGIGQVLVIAPSRDYIRPARDGFIRDAGKLRQDAKRVTRDLRAAALKHGKSPNVG